MGFIQRARARQHPETNTPLFLQHSSAISFCSLVEFGLIMGTMMDPETALSAIKAAGDDFQSLYEAIKKAEFLASTPGDYRQQLRAAKAKLKKIHLEAKKKAEEDAKKGIVQKNYDVSKYWPQLKDTWETLRWRLRAMPGGATKKPDAFYDLYGFFKQATEGDNTEEQPVWAETGGLDFEGRSRWEAWNKTKGISSEVAKKKFVAIYFEMDPRANLYNDNRVKE